MFATNYFEDLILEVVRGQTATAPSTLYLALYLSNPGETGQGGAEVSYTGYQRQVITFSAPALLNGGLGTSNDTDITFPESDVAIGSVTHVGVLDSVTGGNMLLYGAFTEPISIQAQEASVIIAQEAQWWITGPMSNAQRTKVLNFLRGTSMVAATPHLALFDGNPEDGGAELIGANYARVPIAFNAPTEQPSGQRIIQNASSISTPRASASWGTLRYYAVMDSEASGAPLMYMPRTPDYDMRKGRMVIINAGDLTLSIN